MIQHKYTQYKIKG